MKKFLFFFSIILLCSSIVYSATINVPGDYATIQLAINAAVDGDIIQIAAGTYTEALSVGKSLTFIGSGPASAPTTIITSTASPMISLTVTGKSYTFQNLIIHGNVTNLGIRAGGSISINSLTMQDVIARNCKVALYFSEGSGVVINNLYFNNLTLIDNTHIGAYIGRSVASGLVTNSIITHNGFTDADASGWQKVGLQFVDFYGTVAPSVVVTNSTFTDNGAGASNIERTGLSFYTALNALVGSDLLSVSGSSFTNHPLYAVRIRNGYNVGNTATVNGTFTNNYLDIWFSNVIGSTSSTTLVRNSFAGIRTVGLGPTYDYNTIQAAVVAATSGDIIKVAAATFTEPVQIDINKNLTLLGVSAATTIVKPGFSTTVGGNVKSESFIYVDPVATVIMKNFTIDCSGQQVNHAIQSRGALDIEDCVIQNVKWGTYNGRGIVFFGGTLNNLVKNLSISNVERIGVHVRGNVMTPNPIVSIQNFIYTGKGSGDWLDYGIEFGGGGAGTVDNVNISNCKGIASTDGSTSASILVTDYWGTGTNATIINSTLGNNSTGIAVGYGAADNSVVVAHNNNIVGNTSYGITSTNPAVNAENNWWGTAVESAIQAMISGPVDYDPWIGKTNVLNCAAPNINYNFLNGVIIKFTTLPVSGGNVTVMRENQTPSAFPTEFTNLGMWIDITSALSNYSFNAMVIADVSSLPGFDATTTPMYKNLAGEWLAIPGGTYLASDPLFGGHPSFSFVTNHFTPFTFINTPATAYNVYLSSSTAAAAGFIYPNDAWGYTLPAYEPNDWDFTTPILLYIVPQVGSEFGASDITVQWDNTLFSYGSIDKTGGIYDNGSSQFLTTQSGNQVTINAGRFDNTNVSILAGQYIAKLNLNLTRPGFGPVSFTALDFRAFDGLGGQLGVFVTGNNGQVKSYLGDVASHTSISTGDGLVDYYDLSPWSISYWSGVPPFTMANYKVKYDVGPTSTNNVYGIPAVDGKIQFEDFVIFAMSYGLSSSNVYPKINAEPTAPVEFQLGEPIIAGSQTRIPLLVSGGVQNVRAMSLTFAGQFGRLVSVEKGLLLNEFTNPVMVMSNTDGNQVYVDLAVFGAEEVGINTEGEVLTLVFEGNTKVNINSADVRNILNGPMAVNISGSDELVPVDFALMQNYPNPFNPTTIISYDLQAQAMVELSIFNALGEKVATLVNEIKDAGRHIAEFNATGYSSGIYFYQIKANDFVSVKKMILMK